MARNDSRSMNGDFRLGSVDGVYKSLTPDRGGDVEESWAQHRAPELNPVLHGSVVQRYDTDPMGIPMPKGTA